MPILICFFWLEVGSFAVGQLFLDKNQVAIAKLNDFVGATCFPSKVFVFL